MHFLGIDGGGSHTRALLCDPEGNLVGEGHSGPSNPMSVSAERCRLHLEEAIQLAFTGCLPESIEAAHFGIAGARSKEARGILHGIAGQILDSSRTRISIGHDLEIALEGGLAGRPGIALIAGTGSACYGKNKDGAEVFCGGWGDLVDDTGSGSWIGLEALKVCTRQADARLPESELKDRVLEHLGIDSMDDFKQRIHAGEGLARTERAAIAPLVLDLAQSGEASAQKIVAQATTELSDLVATSSRQLADKNPAVVLLGGLNSDSFFQATLANKVRQAVPGAQIARPELPPAVGALLIALSAGGIATGDLPLDALKNST